MPGGGILAFYLISTAKVPKVASSLPNPIIVDLRLIGNLLILYLLGLGLDRKVPTLERLPKPKEHDRE